MNSTTLLLALGAALSPLGLAQDATNGHTGHDSGREAGDFSTKDLPVPVSAERLAALAEELLLDEPGDGRTWARGPQWKASFGPEGLTYIPFFGSDAPQNYPVTFDLREVRVGGARLPLTERTRTRDGRTVALDRGQVREVYHLDRDTVEQTFVFDQLEERSEIVLEVQVTTELQTYAEDGGFVFSNALGDVRYGRATAFDASGQSMELQQEWTGRGFRMVVPEEFVRSASLPLVVDPIIRTLSVTNNSRRQLEVDVAYEGNNSTYQIVYSELQSAIDQDVIAASYNAPLDLLFPAVSIDTTSASWGRPRNASNFLDEQFLCVSVVGFNIGSRRVWGRTREAGSGVRGAQFQISGIGAETVDVGGKGNSIASSFDYMVVWQEADNINNDFDIVAQAVRSDSVLQGSRITIDGDPGDMDRAPSISKTSGRPGTPNAENEYMIVWEREISPTNRNIRAQVIEYTGSMTGHSQFNAYTFGDSIDPDVSSYARDFSYGGESYWVLAFERLTGGSYKIFTVVARDGDADNARNVQVMQNFDLSLNHRDPVLAFDGEDFLIAYQTEEANGDSTVHVTAVNVIHDDGELRTALAFRRDTLGTSEGAAARIGIASHWDGGGPFGSSEVGDALTLWTARDGSSNNTNVDAAIVAETSGYSAASQYCAAENNSTGQSAWMKLRQIFWSAGSNGMLQCFDLPQNSFGHFIVSNQSGFVVNPGGSQGNLCLQGTVGRFNRPGEILNSGVSGSFGLIFDSATLPSPMGAVGVAPGETWYYQCWFRDIGPSSNFSNAVEMTYD